MSNIALGKNRTNEHAIMLITHEEPNHPPPIATPRPFTKNLILLYLLFLHTILKVAALHCTYINTEFTPPLA